MKIKILRCCAGLKFSFSAGEFAVIDDETARDLIQAGYAEDAKPNAESEISAGDAGEDSIPDATAEDAKPSAESEMPAGDAGEGTIPAADAKEVKPSGKGNRSARKRASNS